MEGEASIQLADQLIDSFGVDGAVRHLARMCGYREVPPTIQQFLDDKQFAGDYLGESLYPTWREVLEQVFPHPFNKPYFEIACTGSIGTGKSTLCLAGMLYDMVCLTYLENPHNVFGLLPSTQLVFAFINTTLKLSESVLVKQFNDFVSWTPYLKDLRSKLANPKKEYLPNNIGIFSGSQGDHALGRAVVGGCLSELNFQGKHKKQQALQNYEQVRRRMESRFLRGDQYINPGRLWLDSSKSDEFGFLERRLETLADDPRAFVVCKSIWQVLGPAGKVDYKGGMFWVFIGDQHNNPRVLGEEPGSFYNIPAELCISVPNEYRKAFDQDIYGALRDLGGKSTWSSHKFISNVERIKASLVLHNPLTRPVVELDFFDASDRLINYVRVDELSKDALYFVHMDIGTKKDRTGIAFTRCTGMAKVQRVARSGQNDVITDYNYRTDMVIPVAAKPGQEVPISKLRNLVLDLQKAGIQIGGVSCDQFQSTDTLQILAQANLNTKLISVDRTRGPYDNFKNALLEGRWKGPMHPILSSELKELIDHGDKIDHPMKADDTSGDDPSKDLADAIAGSIEMCRINSEGSVAASAFESWATDISISRAEKNPLESELMRLAMLQKGQQSRSGARPGGSSGNIGRSSINGYF